MPLHVVLVEPAGPLNVGSVARLCANFGVSSLRLVAPRCDPLGEEARRMAVHGLRVLETAARFASLQEALADCGRVVACSGRPEGEPLPLLPPAQALAWLLAESGPAPVGASAAADSSTGRNDPAGPAAESPAAALVFGREDRGLANAELLLAGRLLQIPTRPDYPSLNLSHAVAVVLHSLEELRLRGACDDPAVAAASAPRADGSAWPEPCRREALEAALADAEALLLEVGFLLPHTSRARMAKLRALLQRAQVSGAEVALLRGMVCQLRWASRRGTQPGERT